MGVVITTGRKVTTLCKHETLMLINYEGGLKFETPVFESFYGG